MTTRTITIDLKTILDSGWAYGTVSFEMITDVATSGASIYPQSLQKIKMDVDGVGSVDLAVPDTGAWVYEVRLPSTQESQIVVGDGAAVTLAELLETGLTPVPPSGDSYWVRKDGANTPMTGELLLSGDPVSDAGAATKQTVDAKQDKDTAATAANVAIFDANGQTVDAGFALGTAAQSDVGDFAPALGVDENYVTDAEKVVISNTSGTNTGDSASDPVGSATAAQESSRPVNEVIRSYIAAEPSFYWPLNDTETPAANYANSFAYAPTSGMTFGAEGIGDGGTAVYSTDGSVDIYSAALNSAFDGEEGELTLFTKPDAANWDGTTRVLVSIKADNSNRVLIYKPATDIINFFMSAGGVTVIVILPVSMDQTDWTMIGMSWSKATGYVTVYINGVEVQRASGFTGTWTGSLSSTECALNGNKSTPSSSPWSGALAHAALKCGAQFTDADRRMMAGTYYTLFPVFFGDSITQGNAASDTEHEWPHVLSAAMGYQYKNSGLSGTLLQNTVQNSIATIGAAAANNGRDTVSARVVAYRPTMVFILYGTNDCGLNDVAITPSLFATDLIEVIDLIVAGGVAVQNIVIGSVPYFEGVSLSAPFTNFYQARADSFVANAVWVTTQRDVKYIDVNAWMQSNGGASLLSADGLHPNDAGHAQIAAAFMSVL